jgi:hypothetical protein
MSVEHTQADDKDAVTSPRRDPSRLPGAYAVGGGPKPYAQIEKEKRYFADRLARVYEAVGMKWWMVGTVDIDGPEAGEPILALIRGKVVRARVEGALVGAVLSAALCGFVAGMVFTR